MTNRQLKQLRQVRSRHGRRKSGCFSCEGLRCCREALTRRADLVEFVVCTSPFVASAEFAALEQACPGLSGILSAVTEDEFAEFAVTENPQGILCVCRHPDLAGADAPVSGPFVLVLDRIQDPGNLGTIMRTAWAVGLLEVWVTQGTTDPFGPKAVRAGMGAQFALDLRSFGQLAEVRTALVAADSATLWCAVPRGGVSCFDERFEFTGCGIVIGNEAQGVSDGDVERAVSIPMPGDAESLNAAQAATVLLFEAVRRGVLGGAVDGGGS